MPKTVKEAVERFIELWDQSDIDLLSETPKSGMSFLCKNLESEAISRCEISRENVELLEDCGSKDMTTKEAAHIIIKALWEDLHRV